MGCFDTSEFSLIYCNMKIKCTSDMYNVMHVHLYYFFGMHVLHVVKNLIHCCYYPIDNIDS